MTIMNEVLLQVKVLYSKLSASKSLLSAIKGSRRRISTLTVSFFFFEIH